MKLKRVDNLKPIGPRDYSAWIQPVKSKYVLVCCDCGLAHQMDFRVVKDRAQFRARRANGYTRRERQKHDRT